MVLVDTFARLGLPLSFSFSFPLGVFGDTELLEHDAFIDLTGPEELVLSHLFQSPFESGSIGHQLTDLSPCVPLCPQQGRLRGRRLPSCNLGAIEPVIPFIKVTLAQIKLLELWESQHTHEEVVTEDRVHPLQLPTSLWVWTFFFLLFFLKTIDREFPVALCGAFPLLRQCRHDVLGCEVPNLPLGAVLELFLQKGITPLKLKTWLGGSSLVDPIFLQGHPVNTMRPGWSANSPPALLWPFQWPCLLGTCSWPASPPGTSSSL